jgi:hypothetical protein
MSRSRKKAWVTLTKKWSRFKERAFRHRVKQACRDAEIDFDPDADFDELHQTHKHSGEEYGTKCGFNVPPSEADSTSWHEEYERLRRK